MSGRVAVFDMCGTLYVCNTLFAFVRWACPASAPAWWLDSAAIKLADAALKKRALRRALAYRAIKRYTDAELTRLGARFVSDVLPRYARKDAHARLARLQESGAVTVLMTSAPDFIARPVARRLGFYTAFSSVYKSGELVFDLSGRKAEMLKKRALWDELFVCTDNLSDADLARLADELVVYGGRRAHRWKELFPNAEVR